MLKTLKKWPNLIYEEGFKATELKLKLVALYKSLEGVMALRNEAR